MKEDVHLLNCVQNRFVKFKYYSYLLRLMLSQCDQQMMESPFSPSLSCIYVRNAQLCMCMLTCINTFFCCITHKMQWSPKFTSHYLKEIWPSHRLASQTEDGGLRALVGEKCYSDEHVCPLSTPSYSPDLKNIIFVYNLEKRENIYYKTPLSLISIIQGEDFLNCLNTWFFSMILS